LQFASYSSFSILALLLVSCAVLGAIFVRLRQPLLITYIFAGVVLGPAGVGLVTAESTIAVLAQLGVTVLLFIVGLKLDLQHVRHIGRVAIATGLGQLTFTIVIGFGLVLLLGRGWVEALYIAVALTFSSTIIIVKLLSDKRELDSLHGRIAVGFLVVQDIAVVIAMLVMGVLRGAEGAAGLEVAGALALRIGGAVLGTIVVMKWVLPHVLTIMGRSQELLLLFAIAWGVSLAGLGEEVGFSKEAGAFLAGFTLASTPLRDAVSSRLTALRDFLLLFFFIELGAGLDLSSLGDEAVPAAVLSVFVLVGNPLIVLAIMGGMGYRKRTGFLAGLTVAQISEFSIIFVAMGISLGHISDTALGLTTLVGMVTITVSTYLILYSHPLYHRLAPLLSVFERREPYRELGPAPADDAAVDVIVFGLGRYGRRLFDRLREDGVRAVGVDFDPELIRELQDDEAPVRYGDAEDADFIDTLPLAHARWVVSTLPEHEGTGVLLESLRAAKYQGKVAVAVRDPDEASTIDRDERVHRVFRPFVDGADHAADALMAALRAS
jgi:Kef-type K+ transport system membrane component KefB